MQVSYSRLAPLYFLYIFSIVLPAILILIYPIGRRITDSLGFIIFLLFLLYEYFMFKGDLWKLFLTGFVTGFLFELLGTSTGFPFGNYKYVAFKSIMFLGVPIPVAIAWGIYITVAYVTAIYLLRPNDSSHGISKYILPPILMVNIDLALDPVMVSRRLWVWTDDFPIRWFNVPVTNFIGWFIVSLTILIIYYRFGGRSPTNYLDSKFSHVSPAVYLMLFLSPTLVAIEAGISLLPILYSLSIYLGLLIILFFGLNLLK